ncbi:36193_t:CDS:1, partial [Racocetra persica]
IYFFPNSTACELIYESSKKLDICNMVTRIVTEVRARDEVPRVPLAE